MAERYWVGGTGIWDGSSTTHWSATTGGAGGASVPTAADNVHFDGNSFSGAGQTVTIQTNAAVCLAIDWTGATNSPQLIINADLNISGAVTFISGMSTSGNGSYIHLQATGAVNINFAGVTLVANMDVSGSGTFTLTGDLKQSLGNASARNLLHSNGTLNFNGKVVQCNYWSGNGSANARTLSCGASVVTVYDNCYFDGSNWTVNLNSSQWTVGGHASTDVFGVPMTGTFNAGTSSITMLAGSSGSSNYGWTSNGKTFYSVTLYEGLVMFDAGTFTNLTFAKNSGTIGKNIGILANQTVTGTFSATGFSQTDRIWIATWVYNNFGSTSGTQRTITAAVVSLTNCDFSCIVGAGAGTWSGTSVGNGGNCSGITFTAPVTRYWVGNGGTWESTAHWSTSSGGASGASMPLPQDTVIFDANSITSGSQTITINNVLYPAPNFSAVTNNPTWTLSLSYALFCGATFNIKGITMASPSLYLIPEVTMTFTTGGGNVAAYLYCHSFGSGQVILGDDYSSSGADFNIHAGTVDLNGRNLTVANFFADYTPAYTLYMRSGTLKITGAAGWCDFWSTNAPTVDAGTSIIIIANVSGQAYVGLRPGLTFYNIAVEGADVWLDESTGGTTTINQLSFSPANRDVKWWHGATYVIGKLLMMGYTGNVNTMHSDTAGSAFTISNAGLVAIDWVSLKDCTAAGGGTFYAGANSTNVSGNTGWTFAAAPYTTHPAAALGAGM